jgi:hypothetical protein
MHSRCIQLQVLDRMTFVTELVALLLEKRYADDPMPQVAILAFPVLDRGMHVAHRKVLFDELLVTVQALLPLELPFPGIGRRCEEPEDDGTAGEDDPQPRCVRLRKGAQHCVLEPSSGAAARNPIIGRVP